MRQFNKLRNTKGFVSLWESGLRSRDMRNQKESERRMKILLFWKKYGFEATRAAYNVGERTLFRWQRALKESVGRLSSLDPKSTAPKSRRKRIIPDGVEQEIVALRRDHRLGKDKLQVILEEKGYKMSSSTVGRILSDLKERGKIPNSKKLSFYARSGKFHEKTRKTKKKQRRPKGMPSVETDTIVRYIDGIKRYILTGIHTKNKTAFAGAYLNHSSKSAADFLSKYQIVSPIPVTHIQTDNGSEFGLHFEQACRENNITQFHTYPRSPKMNAVVERFNRTLDEDFIQPNRALLRDNIQAFNEKLADWLIWYNTVRPHYALGQVPPMRYTLQTLSSKECHMWWTHTII